MQVKILKEKNLLNNRFNLYQRYIRQKLKGHFKFNKLMKHQNIIKNSPFNMDTNKDKDNIMY